MAFAIGNVRMEVQDKTRVVTVPNHPVAKLMYYLDCVCDALQIRLGGHRGIAKLPKLPISKRTTEN